MIPGSGRSPGEGIGYSLQYSWASLVAQLVKNLPTMWETWVQKIPWRKERLPTPVFWPGEFHGVYSPWGRKEKNIEKVKVKVAQLCLTLCNPMDYSPLNSPGQNTGVGSLSLFQGIFPTQGLNPGLPHGRWILYQLNIVKVLYSCNFLFQMDFGISHKIPLSISIVTLVNNYLSVN